MAADGGVWPCCDRCPRWRPTAPVEWRGRWRRVSGYEPVRTTRRPSSCTSTIWRPPWSWRRCTASTACSTWPPTVRSTDRRLRSLAGAPPRFRLPGRLADTWADLRWRFQRGPIPPGLRPYTRWPWLVANDRLKAAGWRPTVTNEQAYVEGTEARWWTMLTPKRKQEISLGVDGPAGGGDRRWSVSVCDLAQPSLRASRRQRSRGVGAGAELHQDLQLHSSRTMPRSDVVAGLRGGDHLGELHDGGDGTPSSVMMSSPGRSQAAAAGLPGTTSTTRTPCGAGPSAGTPGLPAIPNHACSRALAFTSSAGWVSTRMGAPTARLHSPTTRTRVVDHRSALGEQVGRTQTGQGQPVVGGHEHGARRPFAEHRDPAAFGP
jgi:hypothetical protein